MINLNSIESNLLLVDETVFEKTFKFKIFHSLSTKNKTKNNKRVSRFYHAMLILFNFNLIWDWKSKGLSYKKMRCRNQIYEMLIDGKKEYLLRSIVTRRNSKYITVKRHVLSPIDLSDERTCFASMTNHSQTEKDQNQCYYTHCCKTRESLSTQHMRMSDSSTRFFLSYL